MSTAISFVHRVADFFWRYTAFPYREIFADNDAAFARAQVLVRATYVIWVVYSLGFLRLVAGMQVPDADLLWHVAWVRHVPFYSACYALLGVAIVAALLAAMYPGLRLLRILTFFAVFEFQGIRYSYGKIDHSSHTWVFALFLLIFLARLSAQPTAREKRAYLEVFWGIQLVCFACYSVAGVQKLWGVGIDWSMGGMTVLHPHSLGVQVADLVLHGQKEGLLGWLPVAYPDIGIGLTVVMLYLELCAIVAVFRPRLHAPWGAAMIAMHLGISLMMNIWFDPMVMMVGLFFLATPFASGPFCLRATVRDLPWLGPPLAALVERLVSKPPGARKIIFYDGECVMCNAVVQLLLRIGVPADYYFASQQGGTWQALVREKPYLVTVDSIVVLAERGAQREVRLRSEAVLCLLTQLRMPYASAWIAMWVPLPLSDVAYRLIARYRKRILSEVSTEACALPSQAFRDRFLD